MKKLKIFQLMLILIFTLFLIFLFKAKNYTKNYTINNVAIKEIYDKETKSYYFTLSYKDITLDYLSEIKYKHHRGLIKEIEILEEDDDFCLIPKGEKIEFTPLCYENKEQKHYSIIKGKLKEKLPSKLFKTSSKKDTYNDIEIFNKDYNYLIWNYNGFYHINASKKEKIKIFDKEYYTINLIGYTKNYLVIADYNSNYTFNRFYVVDIKNGNLKKYNLKNNIYFDSYFIGYEKNKIYIVDSKEQAMYEFNAKNGKLTKIKSKIKQNGKWQKVSIKTLINKKQTFAYKTNYNYLFENGILYLKYQDKDIKTKITNNVTSIVKINNSDIFYLKTDTLYHFNPLSGEEKLLTYFEWNFNYENMIYIN